MCSQVGGTPESDRFMPFHLNHIVPISSPLQLAPPLWTTSSFSYCSRSLCFGGIVWKKGFRAVRQAKLTFGKALFFALPSPGDSLKKGYQ